MRMDRKAVDMGIKESTAAKRQLSEVIFQEDILSVILAELPRADLKSTSLVNHDFALVSRSFIFQVLVLNLDNEEKCRSKLETMRTSPTLPGYVKRLVIVTPNRSWDSYVRDCYEGPANVEVGVLVELQDDVINGVFKAGLTELRWEAGFDIPVALVEAVQTAFPNCTFVLECYVCAPLPPMPNLVSLSATVHCHCDPLVHFQPILRHSPRLKHLNIQAYVDSGCVMRAIRMDDDQGVKPFLTGDWDEPICGVSGPFLESLILQDEMWSERGAAKCVADMSWSHLRTLELQRCDADLLHACSPVSSIMPQLASFKYTTWDRAPDARASTSQALQDFLTTANGLQDLHLEGPYHSLMNVIAEHHGETLQSLILHDHERPDKPQRVPMSTTGLIELGKRCLSLQHLGIDVGEDYTLPFAVDPSGNRRRSSVKEKLNLGGTQPRSLTAILNYSQYFPALCKVTLYALLGIARAAGRFGGRQTFAPLNVLQARVPCIMFPDIDKKSSSAPEKAAKIRTIIVRVGEADRRIGVGYPAHWVIWEQEAHTVVTLQAAVDGPRDVRINVSQSDCLSLSYSDEQQPIGWTVAPGNKWVVTKKAPKWEEYLASLKEAASDTADS